jgi:hypothetical protein
LVLFLSPAESTGIKIVKWNSRILSYFSGHKMVVIIVLVAAATTFIYFICSHNSCNSNTVSITVIIGCHGWGRVIRNDDRLAGNMGGNSLGFCFEIY